MADSVHEGDSPPGQGARPTARVTFWGLMSALMAVAILLATAEQARLAIGAAEAAGINAAVAVGRLLSFFTVQSNLIAAAVLSWVALVSFTTRRRIDGPALAFARAAATTYMLVTGLVYNIVLRAAAGTDIMLGWSNDVHHVYAPAFLLLDLLLAPRRRALRWRSVAGILVFPIAWVAYTLARGPFLISPSTGEAPWYPYPFLNPGEVAGGYLGVSVWVAGIAVVIAVAAWITVYIGRRRSRAAAGETTPRRDRGLS
ncbi:hypothetical protein GCM10009785_21960 [Brooklawnia cerclae]|nr:Pr6Pr family membrane protein [Brooklawnia cerclae]